MRFGYIHFKQSDLTSCFLLTDGWQCSSTDSCQPRLCWPRVLLKRCCPRGFRIAEHICDPFNSCNGCQGFSISGMSQHKVTTFCANSKIWPVYLLYCSSIIPCEHPPQQEFCPFDVIFNQLIIVLLIIFISFALTK